MQAITFLQTVQQLQLPVLQLPDVARIIGKSREYAGLYIHRLTKKGIIHEVERGKYTLLTDPFEIASHIVFPSYLSFLSAYSIYGLTTQIPINVQTVALKPRKPLSADHTTINFITFKKENIFGYSQQPFRDSTIFIADKEKAIVDSLYLPEHCPISETMEAIATGDLDIQKLVEYALRMDSIVTLKRLGYLLETRGIDVYDSFQEKLNVRYDLLNPFLKRSALNSTRWKLNINEVFT